MQVELFSVVVVSFVMIHIIEMIGFNSRSAGVSTGKVGLGYMIQNTTYTFTRLFYICLLPILGLLTDHGTPADKMVWVAHISLLLAFVSSVIIYIKRMLFINYYSNVIIKYYESGGMLRALFKAIFSSTPVETEKYEGGYNVRIVLLSSIVYMIYSVGVFSVFILAAKNNEYRGMLSHLSGVINGIATVLLTIKVEPAIARYAESNPVKFDTELTSLMVGRLIGVGFLSQIFIYIWSAFI